MARTKECAIELIKERLEIEESRPRETAYQVRAFQSGFCLGLETALVYLDDDEAMKLLRERVEKTAKAEGSA